MWRYSDHRLSGTDTGLTVMSKRETRPKGCQLTPEGIKPCKGLDGVLQLPGGQGTRRQGAELQSVINTTTLKFSRQWVALKSGDHGKNGIVMNYCPFCGNPLLAETAGKAA
jgi:hypothetical protein